MSRWPLIARCSRPVTVTAAGPMSGPYTPSAFGDAIFDGQVIVSPRESDAAAVKLSAGIRRHLHKHTDIFEANMQRASSRCFRARPRFRISRPRQAAADQRRFSNTPPDPAFAPMTPATTPADLASVFAKGFGPDFLITNSFRLSYLQDAKQPIPTADSHALGWPAARQSVHPLRQALKTNDLRGWTPTWSMLLCAGKADPTVFYLNTQLMQDHWAAATPVTVLDIDSAPRTAIPTRRRKRDSPPRRISCAPQP